MSTKTIQTNKKGFTIIEVVLVLAIAGLIFLMVFVALPALQRNQRDTQRKNDVGRMVTAITNYYATNGTMPTTASDLSSYLDSFNSPSSGTTYVYNIRTISDEASHGVGTTGEGESATKDELTIYTGAECADGSHAKKKVGAANFAVVVDVESGESYCQDNS